MKVNLADNQSKQNFFFRIDEGFLFIRSENETDFNKLALGNQRERILCFEVDTGTTMWALISKARLTKTYGLPANFNFNFNFNCFEIVATEDAYQNIKENVADILIKNPKARLNGIFLKDILRRREITSSKKVGRQKNNKDVLTGEISGVKPENLRILKLWEEGKDIESIRFIIYPTTKMQPTKRVETSKIKRKLRDYRHLLNRKYDGK